MTYIYFFLGFEILVVLIVAGFLLRRIYKSYLDKKSPKAKKA